ncbi:hypothetical protein T06_9072 [Trichinella sp. T6]|nr:hypothetical protein T06_9072 [Trichinella sp. T6]
MFAPSISALTTDLNANLSAISICLLLSLCVACIIFVQRNEIRFMLVNQ